VAGTGVCGEKADINGLLVALQSLAGEAPSRARQLSRFMGASRDDPYDQALEHSATP
jgi:hypothetical protein